MENHPAKHFVLQLGSLASLYLSLSFLLVVLFSLINIIFPDAADSAWELTRATEMVRLGFAMTIVFFPAYLAFTWFVNQERRITAGSYLGLTKWLIYLSLLIGSAALLIDLVVVVVTFLNGEITDRFVLKALSVLVVVGAAVYYYLRDVKGFWVEHEKASKAYGLISLCVVLVVLISGLLKIDSPSEARSIKIDQNQVNDLRQIQNSIERKLVLDGKLSASLTSLDDRNLPTAPEDRDAYEYYLTDNGFKLCATFASDSLVNDDYYFDRPVLMEVGGVGIINPNDWQYSAGRYCFERVIESSDSIKPEIGFDREVVVP